MIPSFTSILGLFSLIASTAVTVMAVTLPSGETINNYSDRLGDGSTQQVLALMLVVMVIAVLVLGGCVWSLFQRLIKNQEDAHKGRDARELEYRKAVEKFADAINRNTEITSRCHDRTVLSMGRNGG